MMEAENQKLTCHLLSVAKKYYSSWRIPAATGEERDSSSTDHNEHMQLLAQSVFSLLSLTVFKVIQLGFFFSSISFTNLLDCYLVPSLYTKQTKKKHSSKLRSTQQKSNKQNLLPDSKKLCPQKQETWQRPQGLQNIDVMSSRLGDPCSKLCVTQGTWQS